MRTTAASVCAVEKPYFTKYKWKSTKMDDCESSESGRNNIRIQEDPESEGRQLNTSQNDSQNLMLNLSQSMFPESPVYEPEEMDIGDISAKKDEDPDVMKNRLDEKGDHGDTVAHAKRKLSEDSEESQSKLVKVDNIINTQALDNEVYEITSGNSTDVAELPSTPRGLKTNKDVFKTAVEEVHIISSDSSTSRPSVDFNKEIEASKPKSEVAEEPNSMNDSQDFHLVLSPSPEDDVEEKPKFVASSDPVVAKDREEVLNPGKINPTRSEGYNYSDLSSNLSQPQRPKEYCLEKGTDQESTDSVGSINIDSPDNMPSVASKMIKKLSNGNSSTPTEQSNGKPGIGIIGISDNESDHTPDLTKNTGNKGKRGKIDAFKVSNTTTPSTISPLQNGNGHSLPINTPVIPTFDVHVSHNEDGEFLSLYVVKTDNDIGIDMYKEYQRFSKRFTMDPYMADVSSSNSPGSVTSTGMINLPNRTSFASTSSSTSTASNRTNDGNFVVPQPPRKSISHPSSTTVKGCEALMKKIQDIFLHVRDTSIDGDRSTSEYKVSVGVQVSTSSTSTENLSNGNASPEEVSKCDKATPKSSLKKRVRGRRPLAGKTKRAILPTQVEEPEYMHGMNSPEMVPTNSENGNVSPKSTMQDDKPLSSLIGTPKSVSKLKQKRVRPTSPRPATPVEKPPVKIDYPGFPPDTLVLAKWVDKRYYSGKVLEITEPNKYLIHFDDGQTKALLDDFIIFGNKKTLPLEGQSVYAMVDEEQNYEPGLVLGIEENDCGTITYRCTTDGDTTVNVTATELYLTEDQAKSIKESIRSKSPSSAPTTPRRRGLRELDLDNIIQGPRSARSRDKGSSSARKRLPSPRSPKASTSGLKSKFTPIPNRKRVASESSEFSESSNSAPPVRLEEVAGVEPEIQRTPRKIEGVKGTIVNSTAGPLQLKGASKQNAVKKNSKLAKFCNDEDTISQLGPIPEQDSGLFKNMHFLLTCTEPPPRSERSCKSQESRHYSSEEDGGDTTSSMAGTDTEDLEFCDKPFNKERLKEQLEAGGATVYSHFDDVPKNKYSVCKLIAPRPCLTAKYIQCIAANIRAVSHGWVVSSCSRGVLEDTDAFVLPAGFSVLKQRFANWDPPTGKRNTQFFKDKLILLCGDQDTFVKFWERVCTLAGANTRVVNEEDLNMGGAIACVTEWDCPHEVQNKANQDSIPLVSTTWVVQCLIEAKTLPPTSHDKFSFMYTEPE